MIVLGTQGAAQGANPELDCFVVPIGDEARRKAGWLLAELRRNGVSADMDYMGRSLRKAMHVAGRSARYAAIFGPDELARGEIKLKNLTSGDEKAVGLSQFTADPPAFIR